MQVPLITRCPHCRRRLLTLAGYCQKGERPALRRFNALTFHCGCRAARKERLQAELSTLHSQATEQLLANQAALRQSGLPPTLQTASLATFTQDTAERSLAHARAVAYAESQITRRRRHNLYISGSIGAGKTYLAAAICNALLARNISVCFTNTAAILNTIKESYDTDKTTQTAIERSLHRARVLVLDDLGKERTTEWGISTLFRIIDHSTTHRQSLIITSNMPLSAALFPDQDTATRAALLDRLGENTRFITLTGPSRRHPLP